MEKQSIALANLLKQKYEIINYTPPYFLKKLPLLGKFYFSNILKKILLNRKPPTYIITCGKRMAGISIFIKSKLNDKIKTIHIQNPGVSIKHFDLLIIPEHDQVTGSNIIQTKGALNFFDYSELENKYEYLRQNNEKTILLMVGGKNKRYTPQSIDYLNLSMKVISIIKNTNGKLLLSVSRRTPQKAIRILDKLFSKSLNNYEILYTSKNNPYPDILKSIDYGIVTSDSVNMISEIATTPIPVFIYKFPTESGKILDFLDDLESLGIIKILDNKLFTYKKTKLNTNKDTALKINKFLGI